MRVVCAVILVTSLLATSAFADGGGLAPGRPAGARQAQSVTTVSSVVLGGAALFGLLLATQSRGAALITGGTAAANAANAAVIEAAALNTTK
jgi:hypothetical protein